MRNLLEKEYFWNQEITVEDYEFFQNYEFSKCDPNFHLADEFGRLLSTLRNYVEKRRG